MALIRNNMDTSKAAVDNYIGTSYDVIKKVYDNLADVLTVSDAIDSGDIQDTLFDVQIERQLGSAAVNRVFTLTTIDYIPGDEHIVVYRNGQRLDITDDYTETNATTLTLTFDPLDGDKFVFITNERTGTSQEAQSINYTAAGTGAVATTVQAKLRERVSATDFGAVADDDGVSSGTDISSNIQAAIDSFNGARGEVLLPRGMSYAGQDIDFKRCALVGFGDGDSAGSGGATSAFTQLRLGTTKKVYTSVEDNLGPHHRDFRLFSATTRTANGQTLLDLTGVNRPRASNIVLRGGENGLLLDEGASIECHYGLFTDIYFQQNYTGVKVQGGNATQSHTFVGGRIWNCVEAYENAEGTADITFVGTAFESDRAVKHTNAGSNPALAETKLLGCRDECDATPDIAVGSLHEIGTYWSGTKKPVYQTYAASTVTEVENELYLEAVRGNAYPIGINILRNPNLVPDASDSTLIPGWTATSGVPIVATHKGGFGYVAELSGVDGTSRTAQFLQSNISVKKGWYTYGVSYTGVGSTSTFTTELTDNGTALVENTDFEGAAVDTTSGTFRRLKIKFLRDIDNLQFNCKVAAINNADNIFFTEMFFVVGRHAINHAPQHQLGFGQFHASAIPTSGAYKIGDIVWNTDVTVSGSASSQYIITGWRRLVTGTAHVLNTDWVEMRTLTGT